MKWNKDQRVVRAYESAIERMSETAAGQLDREYAYAPEMTPIEQIMFLFLLAFQFGEGNWMKVSPQEVIKSYRVDFLVCFMGETIVIECDGHEFHEKTKEQAQKDKKRDREIQALGSKVLRFTGSELWRNEDWQQELTEEFDAIRERAFKRHLEKKAAIS